jgi:PAS domain S-box-containing protein
MDETKPDGNTAPPPPLRVLILEDEVRDAKLMAKVLEGAGVRVQFDVTDLAEVFRANLETSEYDVILADHNLRNWTAFDAIEILKQSGKDIPLIVVTGSLGDEAAAECIKRGAADFVLKDRPARLPIAVQRALEEKRLREERKQAEETLRESEAGLAAAQRIAHIGSWHWDVQTDTARWSDETFRIFGLPRRQLEDHRRLFLGLIHPEDKIRVDGALTDAVSGIRDYDLEYRIRIPERTEKVIHSQGEVLKDEAGKPLGMRGIIHDITESKRAEAEHVRLVTAIEQSTEAVVITDTHGAIEYVNPAFTRITGYSRTEALGQNPRILKSDKQDPAYYQQLWETILDGRAWHGELVNRRKDGSLYTEQTNIAPVRGALGEITHFIATTQDVTERKVLEKQLRQATKMEAVGRLAGGVAHDFNNLLTVINGYTELLMDKFASDPGAAIYLKEIAHAGERAASLTRQLLAFSRSQVLAPQVLDLNEVVSNLEKMLKRMIGEDIDLGTVLAPSLGRVKADPGQIEQVIMNLVVNARDAMPRGGSLTIETSNVELDETYARNHPSVEPGPHVMLAVTDTGVGMTAETQAHIFEPFFTTKERGKGTGLGLATVYGIIKQSGGSIWAYSELGQGSVFKIYLPIVSDGRVAEQLKTEPDSYEGTETILVVEDEEGVRSMINLALLSAGYEVLETDGAECALEICAEYDGPIHLLLTDVVMPQVSGPMVAEKVAALRPEIKVLYMSGYTDDSVVRHGVLTQETPFIQKPFSPLALRKKIREVLGENKQEMEGASGAN